MIITRSFYTAIVLSVDVFMSRIIDEKHFGNIGEANTYKDHIDRDTEFVCVIVKIS